MFHRIVYYALLVGILAGFVLTLVQFWQVIPIIESAESFEQPQQVQQAHSDSNDGHHHHGADQWAPGEGFERSAYTLLTNILVAIAFAILLLVAMIVTNKDKTINKFWRYALGWSIAGYIIFFLAPAFGLPPKIPLATAPALEHHQLWWLFVVISTAAGLAILAFIKSPWRFLVALILLAVPYFMVPEAPAPELKFVNQPPEAVIELEQLAYQFIRATAITNAVLWFILGFASVLAFKRMVR